MKYIKTVSKYIFIEVLTKILTRFGQMVQKLPSTDVTQCQG